MSEIFKRIATTSGLGVLALLAACTKHNPLACCVAADDCTAIGASAPEPCPNGLTCVLNECQLPPDAALDAPSDALPACTSHAECGSPGACLPDGSCGTDSEVAWVAPMGSDSGSCTRAMPCATITHALIQNKPYIKVGSGTITDQPTISQTVTILADAGAQVVGAKVGPIVTVTGTSLVTIYDLGISQGPGATGYGIVVSQPDAPRIVLERVAITGNAAQGVAIYGGTLTMSRCTVFNNNTGGIFLGGAITSFDITNTIVVRNGNSSTGEGGVVLTASDVASSRFAFNTVVDNNLPTSTIYSGGVTCDLGGFSAPNNILARNYVNVSTTASNANHIGQCTYPTTAEQQSVANLNFKSPDSPPYDYHLSTGSIAIDQATTVMAVDVDVDGDHRPQGAAKDQGADEYK